MVNVYSLRDRKLRQYSTQLMMERNDYAVERLLGDALGGQPDSMIAKHPEDFDLYQLGEFDDESGILVRLDVPRQVCCLTELLPPSKEG